ncbi:MAG TPA: carboxypeptidase-like regulatory domain-containing protein [Gemmatimonadaceae bacterium]
MRRTFCLAAALCLGAVPLAAQRAELSGTVSHDSTHGPIAAAEVRLPQLDRITATSTTGEFRFDQLPAGRYEITIRAVGFAAWTDSVDVANDHPTRRDFALHPVAVPLDTVRTRASGQRYISPMLRAFEQRRLSHEGGYFVSDSEFRRDDNIPLATLLTRHIAGLMKVNGQGSMQYVASGRSTGNDGGPIFQSKGGAHVWCFATIYIDGVLRFVGPDSPSNPPPDLNELNADDFAGAEYYPGGASVPAEYNATGSSCGVLLLWTRER